MTHRALARLVSIVRHHRPPREVRRAIVGACCLLSLGGAGGVFAAPLGGDSFRPREATSGTLLLRSDDGGEMAPAPTLHTDVAITVSGMIARVTVRQEFTNPGSEWAEGIYVFPLPDGAAVDHMRLRVGERIIEGQIKERAEAKKAYTAAKRAGKRASLVEQERPNIFTTSVANIAPGATVTVEIEYQETVRYDNPQFQLRFPMVVGPRYIPGTPVAIEQEVGSFDGHGWAVDTDQVPDASRITPPVQHPDDGPINPVSLRVDLDAGLPLARVESLYHRVQVADAGNGRRTIALRDGDVPADRDFVLTWEPATGTSPKAALFTEEHDGDAYALLMVMPPQPGSEAASRLPRETIFVIDTSGSMHGKSIAQAKAALLYGLTRLQSGDKFNVIQFNSTTSMFSEQSVPATSENVKRAKRYVRGLEATGGTEMLSAVKAALSGDTESTHVRQVIFMTDGAVGNEAALFSLIKSRLGNSRLFTIGIGSAPNSHFMTKAARFGRGTFTYIGKTGEVDEKMRALLRKLDAPALTDIALDTPGRTDAEVFPARIPDLYMGEPVVVAVRFKTLPNQVTVRGRLGQDDWSAAFNLTGGQDREGVSVLWARRKIASLMDSRHDGVPKDEVRQAVLGVALAHHLVSKYTSLVAVDVTPVRPATKDVKTHAMKTNLPDGWTYEKVFGMPQTATWAQVHLLAGLAALLAAGAAWWRRGRLA